jgi:hypothetical protein
MAENERCNVNVGTVTAPRYCGKEASNWCYNTSGPKTHNHNVCDDHWDSKKKTCVELDVPFNAPGQARQRSSGGDLAAAPRPIRPT